MPMKRIAENVTVMKQVPCTHVSIHKDLEVSCKHGRISEALGILASMEQHDGISITSDMVYPIIQSCFKSKDLISARKIRTFVMSSNLRNINFLNDNLIRLFASCGSLQDAYFVFLNVHKPSVCTWNSMISAYSLFGKTHESIRLYTKMIVTGFFPDKVTFLSILKACANMRSIKCARHVHHNIIECEYDLEQSIRNTILAVYYNCGCRDEALSVFNKMQHKDVVTWSAVVAGFTANGNGRAALKFFENMLQAGVQPNAYTYASAIKACGSIGELSKGYLIHEQLVRSHLESDQVIAGALVDMYGRCGSAKEARKVFDGLTNPDIVSWGGMILAYTMQEDCIATLELFAKMYGKHVKPNRVIYLCILKACGILRVIEQSKFVHHQIIEDVLESDVAVGSILLDMYIKCGSMEDAMKVFKDLQEPDAVTWGAMVSGYAAYGSCEMAWEWIGDMHTHGLKPSDAAFTSILTACGNAGRTLDGCIYFKKMIEYYGVVPNIEHFGCMIDLFGRAGKLQEAEAMLCTMPVIPDAIIWRSFLTTCKNYSNLELGIKCFDRARSLDPDDASIYVLMSSMYAELNKWEDVDRIESLRKSAGAQKMPGMAWIEVGNKVYQFVVLGESKVGMHQILDKFQRVGRSVKCEEGFVPLLESVFVGDSYSND